MKWFIREDKIQQYTRSLSQCNGTYYVTLLTHTHVFLFSLLFSLLRSVLKVKKVLSKCKMLAPLLHPET